MYNIRFFRFSTPSFGHRRHVGLPVGLHTGNRKRVDRRLPRRRYGRKIHRKAVVFCANTAGCNIAIYPLLAAWLWIYKYLSLGAIDRRATPPLLHSTKEAMKGLQEDSFSHP